MQTDATLPPFLRRSPFLRRLEAAATIGRIVRSNGRYLSLPPGRRCPPEPFEPRLTAEDRRHLEAFERRLLGGDRPRRRVLPLPPSRRGREWRRPDWWECFLGRRGEGGA